MNFVCRYRHICDKLILVNNISKLYVRLQCSENNSSSIKELNTPFVQEIDNMEHITPKAHLKHINTSTFSFMAEPHGQTLV